jgi:hypothetical protein
MRALTALIASLYLPFGANWGTLEAVGPQLLVSGSAVSGSACQFLLVDRRTLRAGAPLRRACDRPPASSHPIVPVAIPSRTSQFGSVRLAHVGRTVTYGPVVLRYEDASDTRPQWTWGAGSLWLYDVATPRGAIALRFDAATGRLVQRVSMPRMFRPVLAADVDGLWLAPAPNGGISGVAVAPVYLVPLGATHARLVHRGGRAALWLVAAGHTVWAEIVAGPRSTATIWRFRAGDATRLARAAPIGFDAVAGGGAIWEIGSCAYNGHAPERVLRVDAETGKVTRVAAVPILGFCDSGALTYAGGALFLLDPPKLFRIRP